MKLCDLIDSMSVEEREALAKRVPTEPGYLWQLAKQWRGKKPSLGLMQKLVAAEPRLTLGELVEEFAGADSGPREASASPAPAAARSSRPTLRLRHRHEHTPHDKPSP